MQGGLGTFREGERGRSQSRGTHARQPQVCLSTGAGCPAEKVVLVAAKQAANSSQGLRGAGLMPVCFPSQLEQFNMMENAISSSSLYSPGSTLNYSQAAMMGLTGSHGSLPDTQPLGYPSHSSIPNIILTGEAACAWHPGWESQSWWPRGAWQAREASAPGKMEPLALA